MAVTYDVIVVGGGIVGASAAYHLTRAGVKTLLIDRHDMGRATDAGAGILAPEMNGRDPDAWFEFAVQAVGYYPELVARLHEIGAGETSYAQCGMLLVAATDDETPAFEDVRRHILARQAKRGAPSTADLHPVDPDEARALFPPLTKVKGALYYRLAARVDGRQITQALHRAANEQGLHTLYGSVDALATQGDQVIGVRVGPDTLAAGAVIVAGGAWSPALGEPLGVRIPVAPQRGQIAHLALPGEPTGDWSIVGAFHGHYIVPWPDGRVAVGATRETGSGFRTETSAAGVREVLDEALRVAPGLATAQLSEMRVGLRPLPPDGLPVLGSVPGWAGLLLATGHGPTGLQLGPFSGRVVAELAQGNPSPADISAFGIDRFA